MYKTGWFRHRPGNRQRLVLLVDWLLQIGMCSRLDAPKSWSRIDKTWQHLRRLTSRCRLFTCRVKDVIFDQIVQAALIIWAKSVVAIWGSVNPNGLMHYLLTEVSGWWPCFHVEKIFMTAIIITCRPILTSRDLQTSPVSSQNLNVLCCLVTPTSWEVKVSGFNVSFPSLAAEQCSLIRWELMHADAVAPYTVSCVEAICLLVVCTLVYNWNLWTPYLINRVWEFCQICDFGTLVDRAEVISFN